MKLDKLFAGLKQIPNGDYVLEGDLICDDNLEIELDDRLIVRGKIEVKKSITAKLSVIAGWGIKAETFIHCEKRIFAGLSVYHTSENCKKTIECAELRKGEIAFGDLVIVPKLKPCPFCGSKNVKCLTAAEICEHYSNDPVSFAVICDAQEGGCGAAGGYCNTKENAIKNWENRV